MGSLYALNFGASPFYPVTTTETYLVNTPLIAFFGVADYVTFPQLAAPLHLTPTLLFAAPLVVMQPPPPQALKGGKVCDFFSRLGQCRCNIISPMQYPLWHRPYLNDPPSLRLRTV